MPYIKQERREAILAGAKPQDAGELNFAITALVDNYLKDKGGMRYAHLNEVIGPWTARNWNSIAEWPLHMKTRKSRNPGTFTNAMKAQWINLRCLRIER
jgi:hypothetical protein